MYDNVNLLFSAMLPKTV